jgi:hypothetical protein
MIRHDLSGEAHVQDLSAIIGARPSRPVVAGEPLRDGDIVSIEEFKFNVDVPDDVAVIVLQSFGWRRAVYFDFGPLAQPPRGRIGPISRVLAQQTAQLWRVDRKPEVPARTRVDVMADGFQRLRTLLDQRCDEEVRYQEVLEDHPWMMGVGKYSRFQRHPKLDDRNIPDFTARLAANETDDIVELKQPFLTLFRKDGEFTSEFHDSWYQAERYLAFARDNRDYLRREKGMRFESPRCILLVGTRWTEEEARLIRIKDQSNPLIQIITYEEVLAQATAVLSVMRTLLLDA